MTFTVVEFSRGSVRNKETSQPLNLADQVALLIYLIMKTLGDRVVPLDPLHPDASTPPARADLPVPVPNIGKFTGHDRARHPSG